MNSETNISKNGIKDVRLYDFPEETAKVNINGKSAKISLYGAKSYGDSLAVVTHFQ